VRLRVLGLAAYAVALGVMSAIGWRMHVGVLDLLAGLQAVWGLGAWATTPDRGRWLEPSALSRAVMVGGLLAESAFLQRSEGVLGHPARLELATVALVVIALVVVGAAWVRASSRALLAAAMVAAVTVPSVASIFLVIEHRYGYVTL
jgi:hypothetical protein